MSLNGNWAVGDWMLTLGGPVSVESPRAEDYRIGDIAESLSKQCRYLGHIAGFYSVAEHSVLCSYAVPPHLALDALLHDRAEAYIGDVIRPVKRKLGAVFGDIEESHEAASAPVFGVAHPMPPEVKLADNAVALAERNQLIKHPLSRANVNGFAAPVKVRGHAWWVARLRFIWRYRELTEGRGWYSFPLWLWRL